MLILCQAAWITPAPHLVQGPATGYAYGPGDIAPAAAASFVHKRTITYCTPVYQTREAGAAHLARSRAVSGRALTHQTCNATTAPQWVRMWIVLPILGSGVLGWCSHNGLWRNGSESDSRAEGWEFESLWPHFSSRGRLLSGEAVICLD